MSDFERITLHLRVNGEDCFAVVPVHHTLLEVLREELALTGTKHGCELGECGTCAVLVDGRPILSCLALAAEMEGKAIETVEGLQTGNDLHPLQAAFADLGAAQCGYCTPGILMTAKALLADNPEPSVPEIQEALAGNLCRCTGYHKIIQAVEWGAAKLRGVNDDPPAEVFYGTDPEGGETRMKQQVFIAALLASMLSLPAGAQLLDIQGVLVEPQNPTTSDNIKLTIIGTEVCPLTFKEPIFHDETVILNVTMAKVCPSNAPRPVYRTFEVGKRPAGVNRAEVRIENLSGLSRYELFEVSEDTTRLALGEDDLFDVQIHWSNPKDGSSGAGRARRLAQDSGAFWFFDPDNLEVTVKILDGRAVNGHWWVFIASMTDLQLEIGISRAGGPVKTYVQTAGANRNFIDVDASFVEGTQQPASDPVLLTPEIVLEPERPTPSDPIHVAVSVLNTEPDIQFTAVEGRSIFFDYYTYDYPSDRPTPPKQRFTAEANVGPLAPGLYTVDVRQNSRHNFGRTFAVSGPSGQLGLHQDTDDSYFNVYVNLDSPHGGVGYGVPLTRESGYFWFFDPDNIELTVKILDGRAVNGNYWVFIASMTDVAYTVEVERCISRFDPFGCGSVFYRSVQGVNQNAIDVDFRENL